MHLFHALIIAVVAFVVMRYILKQSQSTSMNNSAIVGVLAFAYMFFFGHRLPFRM